MITYNGVGKISVLAETISNLHPRMTLTAREDKISVNVSYRLADLETLTSKMKWYRRKEVKYKVPCIRFGIRRNYTLREVFEEDDDVNDRSKLASKLAAALEMLLR